MQIHNITLNHFLILRIKELDTDKKVFNFITNDDNFYEARNLLIELLTYIVKSKISGSDFDNKNEYNEIINKYIPTQSGKKRRTKRSKAPTSKRTRGKKAKKSTKKMRS